MSFFYLCDERRSGKVRGRKGQGEKLIKKYENGKKKDNEREERIEEAKIEGYECTVNESLRGNERNYSGR